MEEGEEVVVARQKNGGEVVSDDVEEGKHDGFYYLDEMDDDKLNRIIAECITTVLEATACIRAAHRRLGVEGKNSCFNKRTQQGRVA